VPGDEHGHDDRLARAGRQLHRDAVESRVRCCVDLSEPGLDPVVADLLGGLGQEDERLQGFNLAEGSRKGEFRIGFSMIVSGMAASAISLTGVHHHTQAGLSQ
jgi:hypothetical protein